MGMRGQRFPRGRSWPAFLLAALAGCSRSPTESPRIETGDVQLRLGTAGVVDTGRWNILRVRARNAGGDFRGVLEIRGRVGDTFEGVVYRLPLEVPGQGAAREISVAVRPKGWTGFQAALKTAGWQKTWEEEILPATEARARILICEARSTDWTHLLSELPVPKCPVSHILPEDLPEEALAYDPFTMVILKGVTLAGSPPGVAGALRRWVQRGGILVAFPGPEWAAGVPPATLELLGVSGGDAGRSLATGRRELEPLPGTERILGGLAFLSRPGSGLATCFSSGLDAAFPERTEDESIHHAIAPALERFGGFNSRSASVLEDVEMSLPYSLPGVAGIHLPSRGMVALTMTIYVLVGLVLPWRFFNRRRRREWTYPILIGVSAIAMVAIARYGLLNAAKSALAIEMSIARMGDTGSRAEVTTYAAVVSPTRREGAFEARDSAAIEDVLAQPLREEVPIGPGFRVLDTFIDARRGGSILEPMTFYPNALRGFRFEQGREIDAILDVRKLPGNEVLVSNGGEDRLLLHVFRSGQCFDIGDVGPGKTRAVDVSTVTGPERSPGERFIRGRRAWIDPDRADMAEALFGMLIESLAKAHRERPFSHSVLLARSNRPVLPLGVPGLRRRAHTVIVIEP